MLRSTAITKELAVIERKISETSNQVLKDALKKKQARLKDELNDAKKSTPQLAKKLLAQRAIIKAMSKVDFNDLIRRLSKKPEYAFLKTMSKSTVKTDLERRAKPVGWRFKGRGNYDKPTMKEIVAGKKNKTVYREVRPRRSDVNLAVRLQKGGMIGDSGTITDSKSMYQGKMGFIEMDMGNEWIVKVLDNGKEKSVTVRKGGFKILNDDKMKNGGGVNSNKTITPNWGEEDTGNKQIEDLKSEIVKIVKSNDFMNSKFVRHNSGLNEYANITVFAYWNDFNNGAYDDEKNVKRDWAKLKSLREKIKEVIKEHNLNVFKSKFPLWYKAASKYNLVDFNDDKKYMIDIETKYAGTSNYNDAQKEKKIIDDIINASPFKFKNAGGLRYSLLKLIFSKTRKMENGGGVDSKPESIYFLEEKGYYDTVSKDVKGEDEEEEIYGIEEWLNDLDNNEELGSNLTKHANQAYKYILSHKTKMQNGGGVPKWEKKSDNYVVGGEGYSEQHVYYTYKNAKIYYSKVDKEWLLEIDNKMIKGFKTLTMAKRRAEMMLLDTYKNGGKMEDGGVIGQEIIFDDSGEQNTGVIKDIHETTGDYIVLTDDGRTVLAQKELDVISLGKMRKQPEAKKRFSFFEDGGNIEKETNEMLMSQIKEVKHHADELSKVVNKNTTIEPWVLAKATRAKTDLSDITHYLDGRKMKYGGKLNDAQQEKFNKVMREWKAGTLHSGQNGPVVKDQDQAIAIAYAQANSMMAFGGMIDDDNVSTGAILRMEELSPGATLDEFIMNSQYIVKSLQEEGFEKDEILTFLAHMMVNNISEEQSSTGTWTQQDQDALEGWISDIQDGYGWITPGYVETSWTSRPGSGTKEWTGDIQRRVYQALIDNNMLFLENENDSQKKGKKVKGVTTAMWAASEENYGKGGQMETGGNVIDKGLEQFKNDEISEGKEASIHLAHFNGKSMKAQSTDKSWPDGAPVTKYFSRNGFKTISPKGTHYILESDSWWYFKIGKTWYAVKKADYGTPPFEYGQGGQMETGGGVDTMSTVNKISRISGLRTVAIREWGEKNNINLEAILKDLKAKKITGMDLMTAIVGKPGNTYSKEFISKYSKMSTGGSMSGWKHKGNC